MVVFFPARTLSAGVLLLLYVASAAAAPTSKEMRVHQEARELPYVPYGTKPKKISQQHCLTFTADEAAACHGKRH
ncbi:hypothetical protein CBOM_06329 [Ceraceosorus bombacis]|uniref:Uncharacterized protein n=1 Tax=Ceraceosorus bombacis TaxID=401625 RepID=A0A0P1BS04_9BASI|nr:hypothetical protein CBOM_06329 [Ceraceosorus bombacis]